MRRLISLLLILTISSIGIAVAQDPAGNTDTSRPSYFFGTDTEFQSQLNQVLVTLAGKDGAPGPQGIPGQDGESVNLVALAPGNSNCASGGVQVVSGSTSAFICQGSAGAQGPKGDPGEQGETGATGASGAAGESAQVRTISTSETTLCGGRGGVEVRVGARTAVACNGGGDGGSSLKYGSGTVKIGACDEDGDLDFEIGRQFSSLGFLLSSVLVKRIDGDCHQSVLRLYFKIKNTGSLVDPGNKYNLNDDIVCEYDLVLTPDSDVDRDDPSDTADYDPTYASYQVMLSDSAVAGSAPSAGALGCSVVNLASTTKNLTDTMNLSDISTADMLDTIGLELVTRQSNWISRG